MRRLISIAVAIGLLLGLVVVGEAAAASRVVRCGQGDDLQQAIDRSDSGDTLIVKGLCKGRFLIIGKDLRLVGGGPYAALDANGRATALAVDWDGQTWHRPASDVHLRFLRVRGAREQGIDAWGNVTVRDSVITHNPGIGIGGEGSVLVLDSVIRRNGGSGINGGDSFRVRVRDSLIRYNEGTGVAGVAVSVIESVVRDNGQAGVAAGPQGDALVRDSLVRGNGGRGVTSENLMLIRSVVRDNGGGGVHSGMLGEHPMTVHASIVAGNRTSGNGGGISCDSPCTVTDSIVRGNTAGGDGGGIFVWARQDGGLLPALDLRGSSVTGNRAGGAGGGVFNGGQVQLTNVTFGGNAPDDCSGC